MEVRASTNVTNDKQIILIGLNKFDVNSLRVPGARSIMISTSDNTIIAVCRVDIHNSVDAVLRVVVDKLNLKVQEGEDEGHEGN